MCTYISPTGTGKQRQYLFFVVFCSADEVIDLTASPAKSGKL